MKAYFEEKLPVQGNTMEVIRTIAGRYMAENPAVSFSYRPFSEKGFISGTDGRWILDFNTKFPEAEIGDYAYAFARFFCKQDGNQVLSISCRNPWQLYVNGELAAQICQHDENLLDQRIIEFPVKSGFNTVFIKCRKNILGFHCVIGTKNVRWNPLNFYTAFAENEGELGWNYCGVFKEDIFRERQAENKKELSLEIPVENVSMGDMWLPRPHSNMISENPFGHEEMYAVTQLSCEEEDEVTITCKVRAGMELYIDGQLVSAGKEEILFRQRMQKGEYSVAVRLFDMQAVLAFDCTVKNAAFALPDCVKGVKGEWLYLDTKDQKARKGFGQFELYDSYKVGKKEYFRCGKDTYIRPVLEQNLYGKSNYPIGVVLYGLLMAADYLQDEDIFAYAHNHLKSCYASNEYMIWDKEKFGCPCINHQLALVDTLDDCGSFASTSLEDCMKYHKQENIMPFADYVGTIFYINRSDWKTGCSSGEDRGPFIKIQSGQMICT